MTKILVIEDLPGSAEMTAIVLRNYGYEVSMAETGESGLRMAIETKPDLILCDYWLPDFDASEFLKRLRSTEGMEDTKVVVCTATPADAILKIVSEHGFNGMIRKPYRVTGFLTTIESQLAAP
jgi:two-component system OmpR family response regulator